MRRYTETINEHLPPPPTFKVGALEKIAARCTRSGLPPTLTAGDGGEGGGQYDMERVFANLFRHLWVRRLARGASSSNWELGRRSRRVPRVRALSVTPPFHRSVQACQARSVSAQVSPVRPGRVLLGSVRPE